MQLSTSNRNIPLFPNSTMEKLKAALVRSLSAEYANVESRLVYQAVNEADALASLTETPLLFLPSLAVEKVQKAAAWSAHQREVLQMQAEEEKAGQKAKVEEAKVDEAEQEFKKTQAATLTASFSGARKISDRNALPALTSKPLPVQKAAPQPFLIRSPSGGERHQAQLFQQNLQSRLTPVPASDAPSTYTELKATQTKNYFNNYPAYVNHQAITINKKNTYIREVPPTQYPAWYERTPGLTYCNSYILGSNVQVNSEFFGLDWPAFYGPAPEGFICQPDFFPTPWIYFPYCDKWRMSGALAFGQGPDADYTGPITVETMEPVTAKIPDKFGVPVFQTINVLDFYNAFYYPEIERWGYMNKQGNFVWLNI